jgi:hypothetical protein
MTQLSRMPSSVCWANRKGTESVHQPRVNCTAQSISGRLPHRYAKKDLRALLRPTTPTSACFRGFELPKMPCFVVFLGNGGPLFTLRSPLLYPAELRALRWFLVACTHFLEMLHYNSGCGLPQGNAKSTNPRSISCENRTGNDVYPSSYTPPIAGSATMSRTAILRRPTRKSAGSGWSDARRHLTLTISGSPLT